MPKKSNLEVKDSITGETYILPELRLKQELCMSFLRMNIYWSRYSTRKKQGLYDGKNYSLWIEEIEFLFGAIYSDIVKEEKNADKKVDIKNYQKRVFYDEEKLIDEEYKDLMFYISEHLYKRGLTNLSISEGNWLEELKSTY